MANLLPNDTREFLGLGEGLPYNSFVTPPSFRPEGGMLTDKSASERKARFQASAEMLFKTDLSKLDDVGVSGLYQCVTEGMFGLKDTDGQIAFGKRASKNPRENLEMLRRFVKGDYTLIEDPEYTKWREMDEEGKFQYALEKETTSNKLKSHIKGERGASLAEQANAVASVGPKVMGPDAIIADFFTPKKEKERKEHVFHEAARRSNYDTLNDEEKAAYRADVIGDYEKKLSRRQTLATYLQFASNLSDKAAYLLAESFQKGTPDINVEFLNPEERDRVYSAFSLMRGDKKRGRILGIETDFTDDTVANRFQMGLYGLQQSLVGLVTDTADMGRDFGMWAYAKATMDDAERRAFFEAWDGIVRAERAMEQPLPEASGGWGDAFQGLMENVHWFIPYGAISKGGKMMSAANKTVSRAKLQKEVFTGAKALAEMNAAAAKTRWLSDVQGAVKAGKGAKKVNEFQSALAMRRELAAVERYTKALEAIPGIQKAAKVRDAAGASTWAIGEASALSAFASEYVAAADAAGVSREESMITAWAIGLVNARIERLYVAGLESSLTASQVKALTFKALHNAVKSDGAAGFRKWFVNRVQRGVVEGAKITATEGLIEEPLQQLATEHGIAFDKLCAEMRKNGETDLADKAEALWRSFAKQLPEDYGVFIDTVVDSLPTSLAFGATGVGNMTRRQHLHNVITRHMNRRAGSTSTMLTARNGQELMSAVDYDAGVIDIIQQAVNTRAAVEDYWNGDESDEAKNPNRFGEAITAARRAYRKAQTRDVVQEVAEAAGVDVKTAEVLAQYLQNEEEMAAFSPQARAFTSLNMSLADIDETTIKTVLPGYIEGSFAADEENGIYSGRVKLGDGTERTIAYRVGDLSAELTEQVGMNAALDSNFGKSFDARHASLGDGITWASLSDAQRYMEAVRSAASVNGFSSGKSGVFELTDAKGEKVRVNADDVIYLANGRLGDIGYGPAATMGTARHETFHSLWRFARATMDEEDVQMLARALGVDVTANGWEVDLDEAMAHQLEMYASGHYVSHAVSSRFDKMLDGWAGNVIKFFGSFGPADEVRDPKTGKSFALKDFYDMVLKGELGSGKLGVEVRAVPAVGAAENPTSGTMPVEVTDADRAAAEAETRKAATETEKPVLETEQPVSGTEKPVSGTSEGKIVYTAENPADASVPNARYYKIGLPNSDVKLVGRLEVRDAHAGLTTSTDEDYHDRGNQNRDDRSEESRALVEKIGANPDPLQIGTVQPIANNGIVWLLNNSNVIIGNHRVNGVRLGYEKGTAGELEKFVREDAAKRGIEIGEHVKAPLTVFILERIEAPEGVKADVHEVVRLANESQNRGFNIREQAGNDAKILIDNNLLPRMAFRPDGRIDETKSADAIGKFRQESGAQGMVGEDGMLTEEGQTRFQNAAVAALLAGTGNNALLGRIMDNAGRLDMASQLRALMKVAPELMSLAKTKPQFDIRDALAEALTLYTEWREKDEEKRSEKGKSRHDWRELDKDGKRKRGLSWEAFMSQGDMFRTPSEEAKILGDLFARTESLRSFDREDVESAAGKKRVVDLITDYLNDYIENARNVNTETDDMFGSAPASRDEVLAAQRAKGESGARFSIAAQREYDDVVSRFTKADGTKNPGWMKAPNGKPTKLTERQWVQVRTPSFKKWFGDWENDPANASKVVDENGEPLVVYHGTLAKGLTRFDPDLVGSRYSYDEKGFFFIDRKSLAQDYATSEFDSSRKGEVIPVLLSLKDPLIVNRAWCAKNGLGNRVFDEMDAIEFWDSYQSLMLEESDGRDGVIIDDGTSKMCVAFYHTQIKSATDNTGAFDGTNADIRFSIVTPAEDAAYIEAVERGDMETARKLLKVAWKRNGYSQSRDHLDAHAAPSAPVEAEDFKNVEALMEAREEGWDLNLWAIAKGISGQPNDFFSEQGPRLYGYDDKAGIETQKEIAKAISMIQAGINTRIYVYRAVPNAVKSDFLQSGGEWVSPSKTYAENHGKFRFGEGEYRIIERLVSAEHLWWDGNDAREWGYDDGRQYVYANTENGSKLATVTYNSDGNVIPLSQRFNPQKNDIRFSVGGIFTGSAADYEKSSLHYVGSGEGSQVYGHGLYGSTMRGVAEGYAQAGLQRKHEITHNGKAIQRKANPATAKELAEAEMISAGDVKSAASSLAYTANFKKGREKALYRAAAKYAADHADEYKQAGGEHIYEQTFFTDRAPGDESHLLKWYEPVTSEQRKWILDKLEQENLAGKTNLKRIRTEKMSGRQMYELLSGMINIGSEKAASEFLARAGIDGVKYPVDSYGGKGVKDGDKVGWNYVSFRDDNIRVDHKWVDGEQRFSIVTLGKYRTDDLRSLAHRVKDGDAEAIAEAGKRLAVILPPDAVLVPMPSHTGEPTTMRLLADAIAANANGAKVVDALRSNAHESNYAQKKRGEEPAEIEMRKVADIPENVEVYIVDNVIDTGATYSAAMKAIPNAHILALADTDRTPSAELLQAMGEKAFKSQYGIGSAARNGEGFVDLERGDTFKGIEKAVREKVHEQVENIHLGITAMIGSNTNADHLVHKDSSFGDEDPEAHKYAVKNTFELFRKAKTGIVHHDKKGTKNDYIRAFTPFYFRDEVYLATITLRRDKDSDKFYSIEAVETERDAALGVPNDAYKMDSGDSPRSSRRTAQEAQSPESLKTGDSPRSSRRTAQEAQSPVSLEDKISYYVGNVNETEPKFVNSGENFSQEELLRRIRADISALRGRKYSVAAEPSPLFKSVAQMSDDELVTAAVAVRMALGETGKFSDRAVKVNTVNKLIRRLHPEYKFGDVGRESMRVISDARKFAKKIREDLDRGVSDSLILEHLPQTAREQFGREMVEEARRGQRLGRFGQKVASKLEDRQARIVEDAVRVQTGMDVSLMESLYGVNLSETLMHLAKNPLTEKPPTSAGAGEGETVQAEEGAGEETESVDVSAAVQAAVNEIVGAAKTATDANERNREDRRAAAGRDAERAAELDGEDATGGGAGDDFGGEDIVAVATKKAGLDLENPRHLAEFVAELTRRYWIKEHELGQNAEVWRDLVAVQFLRKTAQGIYAMLCKDLTYSRSRETAMQHIAKFDHAATVQGLLSEMEFVGALINAQRIRDTQKALCEKLDLFLRQKFGAQGRFKPDKEEGKRNVSAEAELRARYMRHAMWLTPDAAADEARELQEKLDLLAVEFSDAGRDRDQSREFIETIRKLNVLREFGALRYKPVGEIEAAAKWWEDFERGESDDIVRAMSDRDIRTKKAAELLAKAFADPKRVTAREGATTADRLNKFLTGHMGFVALLNDCMRHASDADREAVKDIVGYIQREIQKAGDGTATEKRHHNDALHAAVESIYAKSFNKVMKEMMAEDDRFLKFMGEVGGKRDIPTKGRAMQLLVSLLQEGRKVEVEDEENPGKTKFVYEGGYHDNIVRHKREGQAAELMKLMSPADMNMIKWLGMWYEQNRQDLSRVCHSLFGIGVYAELPNYFPVKMRLDKQGLEKGAAVGWTIFPKALTPRVKNERDFDTSADIFQMWSSRMEEGAQWKHHAQLGLEMRGIFGRAELQGAVISNHGEATNALMQGFITDVLAGKGAVDRSTGDVQYISDKIRGWTALCALGGNVGVMLKQTTSIPAFGFEIGLADTARHIVSAFTPEGLAAMGKIWQSEQRKTRWDVGNSEAVANALNKQDAGWLKRAFQASMITNKLGDVVPALVVGQGVYRDCVARGMSEVDAMAETWMLVERTQQSSRMENLASVQRRNRVGRIMFQFLSTQRQYLDYELRAIREVIAQPSSVNRWKKLGTTILLNHFILSSAYYWMGQLYKAMLGQEPPEDELTDWVITCLLGPYGSLFVAGFCCNYTLQRALKGYSYGGGSSMLPMESWLKNQVNDGAKLVEAIFDSEGDTWDNMLDAAGKWMSDSNSLFRDLRKIYRFRIKGEEQKKRK